MRFDPTGEHWVTRDGTAIEVIRMLLRHAERIREAAVHELLFYAQGAPDMAADGALSIAAEYDAMTAEEFVWELDVVKAMVEAGADGWEHLIEVPA